MTGFFLANGSQEPNWHKGKSRRTAPAARVFTSGQTRAVYFGFDLGTPDAWPRLNLRFTAATYTSGIIPTLRIFVSRPVGGLNELSSAASHSRHRHAVCSHRRRGSSQISVIRIELRERVREALEFAATETRSVMPPAQVSIWKAPMKPASSEGPSPSPLRL
jgi:hypothetical protein